MTLYDSLKHSIGTEQKEWMRFIVGLCKSVNAMNVTIVECDSNISDISIYETAVYDKKKETKLFASIIRVSLQPVGEDFSIDVARVESSWPMCGAAAAIVSQY